MRNDNILKLCKHLIQENYITVIGSAIRDCHCRGLHSFILNEKPRIRLFIADETCELRGPYNAQMPVIPVHAHKYDDLFFQLQGQILHQTYAYGGDIMFKKYKYMRLSNRNQEIVQDGFEKLHYKGGFKRDSLAAHELHSVSVKGKKCSWVIIETGVDANFEQVAYHQNLIERPDLYKPFPDPIAYIKKYLGI